MSKVKAPNLKHRCYHSAAALNLSPGLTVVTIFGGCPKVPEFNDKPTLADTTVLLFGKFSIGISKYHSEL